MAARLSITAQIRLRQMVQDLGLEAEENLVTVAHEAMVALTKAFRAWLERDETAEGGPDHPSYVLAPLPVPVLTLMLRAMGAAAARRGVAVHTSEDDSLLLALVDHAVRDELDGRIARLEADAAGEPII